MLDPKCEYYTTKNSWRHVTHWLTPFQLCYEPFPGPENKLVTELNRLGKHVAVLNGLDAFSEKAEEYWERADVITTNPPFKVLKQFFNECLEYEKSFITIMPCYMMVNLEDFFASKFSIMH